jgi:fatty-acyl-CoA synthase
MTANSTTAGSFYDPQWTIPLALERAEALSGNPEKGCTFVLNDGSDQHFTFDQIRLESQKRGRHLLALGLNKGDRVGFVIPEGPDFVFAFLGATSVGIIPVPLYPPLGFGKLDSYVRDTGRTLRIAGARMLVTSKKVQPILWSLVTDVECIEGLHCVDHFWDSPPAHAPEPEHIEPDDVAFLQFTSGSTADPKGVVVTNRSLGANVLGLMEHGIGLRDDDVAVSWLPLYHDMGLIGMIMSPLARGMSFVLAPTMSFIKRPSRWIELLHKYKGTVTFAPNFAYGLAQKRTPADKVAEYDLSRVRILGAGAEPNHPGTLEAFMTHFSPAGLRPEAILPVYGMAEATLAMTFSRRDQPLRVDRVDKELYHDHGIAIPPDKAETAGKRVSGSLEFVSCGWAIPNHRVTIRDDKGSMLPDRTVGEIVFEGPSVTSGYYENPEATAKSFREDGLRTGDMGYMIEGELFVSGRQKDLVILNGRNYDPHAIEWAVAEVPGIRKGNVVAFSCPGANTEILVVVAETKKKENRDELVVSIRKHLREEFSLNASDVLICDPGTLPKTTSGKLQRSKTQALYLAGTVGDSGVRTLGNRGQRIALAKHVARSMVSRVRHGVRKGTSGIVSTFRVARS